MEPFSVIAFDPGGTTGIAFADYNGMPFATIDDFNISTYELGPTEHHDQLYESTLHWLYNRDQSRVRPRYVVSESFEFRQNLQKKNVELISKEYIGILKLVARRGGAKYFERNASQAKSFVTDKKLETLGILEIPKHPNRHRNDALRHLIMYLVVNLRIQTPITNHWKD